MTRVLITGSRDLDCKALATDVVTRLVARYGADLTVIHGAARGVDAAFDRACRELGVAVEPHPAAWREHGNRAGPLRNQAMLDAGADMAVAVHPDLAESKGTRDMCFRLLKAGIPTWWIADVAEPLALKRLTEDDLL